MSAERIGNIGRVERASAFTPFIWFSFWFSFAVEFLALVNLAGDSIALKFLFGFVAAFISGCRFGLGTMQMSFAIEGDFKNYERTTNALMITFVLLAFSAWSLATSYGTAQIESDAAKSQPAIFAKTRIDAAQKELNEFTNSLKMSRTELELATNNVETLTAQKQQLINSANASFASQLQSWELKVGEFWGQRTRGFSNSALAAYNADTNQCRYLGNYETVGNDVCDRFNQLRSNKPNANSIAGVSEIDVKIHEAQKGVIQLQQLKALESNLNQAMASYQEVLKNGGTSSHSLASFAVTSDIIKFYSGLDISPVNLFAFALMLLTLFIAWIGVMFSSYRSKLMGATSRGQGAVKEMEKQRKPSLGRVFVDRLKGKFAEWFTPEKPRRTVYASAGASAQAVNQVGNIETTKPKRKSKVRKGQPTKRPIGFIPQTDLF